MKIISWNVNGLRSVLSKDVNGFKHDKSATFVHVLNTLIHKHDPDVICLQETKCPDDLQVILDGMPYSRILSSKTRKGYSGVAIFSRNPPIRFLDSFKFNEEGRVIVAEYRDIFIVNTYVPNSKPDLSRLSWRMDDWEVEIRSYIKELEMLKPVVFVGDFNVAHTDMDVHDPKSAKGSHGFTDEEKHAFKLLLEECDLVDSFRHVYPNIKDSYTWYSPFHKARLRNKGWRIDYQLVSESIKDNIKEVEILSDIFGSDHVPTLLELSL